jgi:hypothetical protein
MHKYLLQLFIIYLFGISGYAQTSSNLISSLIQNQQLETARVIIEANLPKMSDANKPNAYLMLSSITALHFELQDAHGYFKRCIDAMPTAASTEEKNDEVEKILEIAAIFRQRQMYEIANAILDELAKKYQNYSSIYYEKANINISQGQHREYFVNFYKGYKINPENPRKWAGLAVVNSVNRVVPAVDNFYWLKAAIIQYDNHMLWANVMQELGKYGLLKESIVKNYAEKIPEQLRPVFYIYFYVLSNNTQKAMELIKSLDYNQDEKRLASYYASFIALNDPNRKDIQNTITKPQGDFYDLMYYYYNFWLSYWDRVTWTDQSPSYYFDYIRDFRKFISQILPENQSIEIHNKMLNWVAYAFINKSRPKEAVDVLNEYLSDLNVKNLEVLCLLYQNDKNKVKTIEIMERMFEVFPDDNDVVDVRNALITDALYNRDYERAKSYIARIKDEKIRSEINNKYDSILKMNTSITKKKTIDAFGNFNFSEDNTDWRKWQHVDACAIQSIYSVLDFWKVQNNDYNDIKTSFKEANAKEKYDAIKGITSYLESRKFKAYLLPPVSGVMKQIIDANVPIILFDTRTAHGINSGHVSVIYGYDDLQNLFLLKDTQSTVCESTVPYDDIFEVRNILAVVPDDKGVNIAGLSNLDALDKIARKDVLNQDDIAMLDKIDSILNYWSYFHNGQYLHDQNDINDSIVTLEKALSFRKPHNNLIYQFLGELCQSRHENQKALEYIKTGLELKPTLSLFVQKIDNEMALVGKDGKVSQAQIKEWLKITDDMQAINPDFPITYFILGDIFAKYTTNYDVVFNAFAQYIEKYSYMNSSWQQKYNPHYEHAQRAIALCKKTIRSKIAASLN